jgi:hypothetical protein
LRKAARISGPFLSRVNARYLHTRHERHCCPHNVHSNSVYQVAASQHEKRKKESERSAPGSLTYPGHTRLILASNGPKIPTGRGEWSMSGQGIEGCNALVPGGQCQSCRVRAQLPASSSTVLLLKTWRKERCKAMPSMQGGKIGVPP